MVLAKEAESEDLEEPLELEEVVVEWHEDSDELESSGPPELWLSIRSYSTMNAFLKCFKLFEWAVGEPDPDPGLDSILKLSFSLGNADLKSQTIINYKIT